MAWEITVAGTLHLDDVTTPAGRRGRQLGGSALYFALAAAPFAPVHLTGTCGTDAEAEFRAVLGGLPVDLGGLTVSDRPTFRWHAVHDFERWVAVTLGEEPGAEAGWQPRLSARAAAAPVLFLGSMPPALQAEVLAQSRARLIGADSMTCYTGPERDLVLEVVEGCDILFLNRVELESLVPEAAGWREAAGRLVGRGRLRALVVKAGPKGAALVTATSTRELRAAPVDVVVDPTGAGDGVAGGFLGLCAQAERDDPDLFVAALATGLRAAAATISTFGVAGLRALGDPQRSDGAISSPDRQGTGGTVGP